MNNSIDNELRHALHTGKSLDAILKAARGELRSDMANKLGHLLSRIYETDLENAEPDVLDELIEDFQKFAKDYAEDFRLISPCPPTAPSS